MTIIKRIEVPYLNEDIIEKYKNVIIISAEGTMIKMNSLILCAMSHSLKMALLELDDFNGGDITIISEFSLEELKQIKEYCTKGSCKAMTESIMISFGLLRPNEKYSKLKLSESTKSSEIKIYDSNNPMEIPLKYEELIDIKEESICEDLEFAFPALESSDSVEKKAVQKNPVKRKKRRRAEKDSVYKCDSCDKNFVTSQSFNRHNRQFHHHEKKPKGSKPRQYSEKELELLKIFELPKPLKDYISKPRNIELLMSKVKDRMDDKNKKNFPCSQCGLKYQNKENLKAHIIRYHNNHLPCSFCNQAFLLENVQEFKKHMFFHLNLAVNAKKFQNCIICGISRHSASDYDAHLKRYGPLHNDKCSQCSKKLVSYQEYQNHVRDQHYGIWKYSCGFCEELFDDEKQCKSHTLIIHRRKNKTKTSGISKKDKPINAEFVGVCELCGYSYKTKAGYNSHMYNHHKHKDQDPVTCDSCGRQFKHQSKHKGHMTEVHLEHQCPQCGILIAGKNNLRNHILSAHTSMEDRPLKCETCGKGFFQKCKLEEHYNVHTGAKPFICKYCPKAYGSLGTMHMHQRSHLGIKRKPK